MQCDQVFAGFKRIENLLFFGQLLVRVVRGLDRKSDPALGPIDLDHAGGDIFVDLQDILDLVDAVFADLGDVNQSVDIVFQTDERSETGQLGNLAADQIADLVERVDLVPRIVGELFHTE